MRWLLASAACGAAFLVGRAVFRRWVRPWRAVEQLVDDLTHGRTPATFLLDGNASAQRIGIAIEDVFLRQRDLTSRAEEGELNVRTILGAMRDGLAVIDAEGQVRLLNAVARGMFGITGERLGERALETFHDNLIAQLVNRTLRNGAPETASINIRRMDDTAQRVAVTSLPMARDDGSPHGAVLLFHDVTQLQQLEQVRREFVSNVSHELRTPLSIFRGYIETLLEEPDLAADERERILRVLEKHSDRLQSLADDLLSLARLESPDPRLNFTPVDLQEFLRRIVADWDKKAAVKQVTIATEVAEPLPDIEADEARLEEVMHNLLDNATKYSPPHAKVTISAAADAAGTVVISVSDEGAGIAAADLPRIFERFYRADKARSRDVGGTGLGLAIVKHIAQLHGGSVDAESQLGRGTTIRVTLPMKRAGAPAAA